MCALVAAQGTRAVAAGAADENASVAKPDETDETAKSLIADGLMHYDLAEYDQAIARFREAYELVRAPALIFNMAQSHRLGGDCRHAVDLYRQFIRLAPSAPERPKAESWVVKLGTCGEPPLAPSGEARNDPGAREATTYAPMVAVPVSLRPEAVASAPPASRGLTGVRARAAGVALIAAGAVLSAPGVYFAWQAKRSSDEIADLFRHGGDWDEHARDVDARGRAAQQTALTLLIMAAVNGLIGGASYVYGAYAEGPR